MPPTDHAHLLEEAVLPALEDDVVSDVPVDQGGKAVFL